MNERKTFALARLIAAIVLAAALLGFTGFAFVDRIAGPAELSDVSGLEEGTYVKTEIAFVMDIVGVERSGAGKEMAYYAVSPVGDTFALLRFPVADKDNLEMLEEATQSFLMGETPVMDIYMTVTGTLIAPKQGETELLLSWFEKNESWLLASGVITDRYDYDRLMGDHVLRVGAVGYMNTGLVTAASVIALLLVLYAVVEAICMGTGAYNKKPKPAEKEETEEEENNA